LVEAECRLADSANATVAVLISSAATSAILVVVIVEALCVETLSGTFVIGQGYTSRPFSPVVTATGVAAHSKMETAGARPAASH